MSGLHNTLVTVILSLGSLLIIAIIVALIRIVRTIRALQDEMTTLTSTIVPLVERIGDLAKSVERTLSIIEENRSAVTESIENIRAVTRTAYRIQALVRDNIEPSVREIASLFGGVRSGLRAFLETWRRPH